MVVSQKCSKVPQGTAKKLVIMILLLPSKMNRVCEKEIPERISLSIAEFLAHVEEESSNSTQK